MKHRRQSNPFPYRKHLRLTGVALVSVLLIVTSSGRSEAQEPAGASDPPDPPRLKVSVDFMGAYTLDEAQSSLGLERQGRIGYVIFGATGRITRHFSWVVEINPIDETSPLPSCGQEHFFFPNTPQNFGPDVVCHNDGRVRVDEYKFVALDALNQQGPIRQAYLEFTHGFSGFRFGQFVVPLGFHWQEVGSLTAKDATHIQRINAEASFGANLMFAARRNDRVVARVDAAAVLGDGNRFRDYNYYYFLDRSFDTNSGLTYFLSGLVRPVRDLDIRIGGKTGETGSKLEILPNFYASKRNDSAFVASLAYTPAPGVRLFGEGARYMWGLKDSSADLLGLDREPVIKSGYYAGIDASRQITSAVRVGALVTREELSRDDALIKYLAESHLYDVALGKRERSLAYRIYVSLPEHVTIAWFKVHHSNPFPWVSGIMPVSGPRAFTGRGSDKWGVVVKFSQGIDLR